MRSVLPLIHRLAGDTGIPLVATNDSHYLRQDDARAHEILLCIQTGKTMSDPNRMRFTQPAVLPQDARRNAGAVRRSSRTRSTAPGTSPSAARSSSTRSPSRFRNSRFPTTTPPTRYFEYVARQGFEKRRARLEALQAQGRLKHDLAEYAERLDREINMIQQMKFSGYFLIVWDFIRFAKQKGIPVGPGRGSAAGSLVSYAMEITDIDPLAYGLLFERFLNPERISMPDIDIDFCTRGRGEVIQYVTEKYGREQVAQIITFGTLGARAAIKDVGRVLDISYADVDRITKLIPTMPLNIKLDEARKMEPQIDELARKDPRMKEVLDVAAAPGRHGAQRQRARGRRGDLAAAAHANWFRSTRPTKTKLSPSTTWWAWKSWRCSRWISWG